MQQLTETGESARRAAASTGIAWNILGQTYVPKSLSESSFSWHATFPPGTFVPPHIHPTQDEFIYMLEGQYRSRARRQGLRRDRRRPDPATDANPARHLQQVRPDGEMLLLGVPHPQALRPVLGNPFMKEQNPPDVVALSAKYEVVFLPPPA